jgi:hypothetical protein
VLQIHQNGAFIQHFAPKRGNPSPKRSYFYSYKLNMDAR